MKSILCISFAYTLIFIFEIYEIGPTLEPQWGVKVKNNAYLGQNEMKPASVLYNILRQQKQLMGNDTVRVSGERWETVLSAVSQNVQWAQHNILQPDKIIFLYISIIDSLSLSDCHTRSKGSSEAHKHTCCFLKHMNTHQVSGGNLFWRQPSASPCCNCWPYHVVCVAPLKALTHTSVLDMKSEGHNDQRMET